MAMPPNRSIEWSFTKKIEFYGLFCGLQIYQKCIGGRGSAPDPTGGAHDAPPVPDLLVGWGGDPTSTPPHLLGASILAPSALRSSCPLAEAWCPR